MIEINHIDALQEVIVKVANSFAKKYGCSVKLVDGRVVWSGDENLKQFVCDEITERMELK